MSDSMELSGGVQPSAGSPDPSQDFTPSDVLDEKGKRYLEEYLKTEIEDVRDGSDRSDRIERLGRYRRLRLAIPEFPTTSEPWEGASNVVTPITLYRTNTITAKLIAMYSTKRPFWSCVSDDPKYEANAVAVSRWANAQARGSYKLNVDRVNREIFYDVVSLGTQFVKVPWLVERWQTKVRDAASGQAVPTERVTHNGPAIVPLRIEDFFCRSIFDDLQKAPWVGNRWWLTDADLKGKGSRGVYENIEQVQRFYAQELPETVANELELLGFSSQLATAHEETRLYPVYEVYVRYDADGDGVPEDIKIWFEVESGTILRSEVNFLGARDIVPIRYLRIPGLLYGVGVPELLEQYQTAGDFFFNHRANNMQMCLTPAYQRRSGSSALKRQKVTPGIILDVEMIDDIRPFVTPDLSASSYQAEALVRDYADRASGANDPMSGYADTTMKSGADVGSLLFLAQQGNSVMNSIYDGIQQDYNEIGQLVLMQAVVNKDLVDMEGVPEEDRALLQEVLDMPVETLPTAFAFRMETADLSRTDEAKRTNLAAAAGLLQQYGSQAMQLAGVIDNPQAQSMPTTLETALSLYIGSTTFVQEALELMQIPNSKELMPSVARQKEMLDGLKASAESGGIPGPGPAPSGVPGPASSGAPGLPGLPGAVPGSI